MNLTLLKRELKANYKIMLIFLALLTMYSVVIVSMFDPSLGQTLLEMAQSMPGLFAAFGMRNVGTSLLDFMANYLYGFLFLAVPSVYILIMANRLMVRYVDKGSMAYLLATPNKRRKIALTQGFFLLLSMKKLLVYVSAVCVFACQLLFPGELDVGKFLLLNLGWFCLLVFLSGVCFCASAVCEEARTSYGVGGGLLTFFLLIQMLSQVGDKMKWLRYMTPMTLFDPQGIIAGKTQNIAWVAILLVAGLVLYAVGIGVFCKKDLSI